MIELKAFRPKGRQTYIERYETEAEATAREKQLKSWGYCVITVSALALPPTKASKARKAKARRNLDRIWAERLATLKPAIAVADAAAAKVCASLSRKAARIGRTVSVRAEPDQQSCRDLARSPAWHYRAQVRILFPHQGHDFVNRSFFSAVVIEAECKVSDLAAAVAFIEEALARLKN